MAELREMTPLSFKPEFTAERFAELVKPLRDGTQEKVKFDTVHQRKDGTQYPVEVHLQLMDTEPQVFVAIILDITERKQAEQESRAAEDLLRTANIETRAINQELLAINEIQHTLFSCRSEAQVARTITDVLVDKFGAYFARLWLTRGGDLCSECALAAECPDKRECLHLLASSGYCTNTGGDHRRVPIGAFKIGLIAQGRGKTVYNDVVHDEHVHDREWAAKHKLQAFAGFPVEADGKVIGVMAMFSQCQLPSHVVETLGILAKLTAVAIVNVRQIGELQEARQVADTANKAKSEFLANMSHEIRTPMTAILGFAENLQDSNLSESERLNCAHTIRRNGEALLGIINDILDLSKIEAGEMGAERVSCEPCSVIAEVASLVRVQAEAKGLPLNIEYDGAIPKTIHSDPARLR